MSDHLEGKFRAAILRDPDNNIHRKAYADWLMESGEDIAYQAGLFLKNCLRIDDIKRNMGNDGRWSEAEREEFHQLHIALVNAFSKTVKIENIRYNPIQVSDHEWGEPIRMDDHQTVSIKYVPAIGYRLASNWVWYCLPESEEVGLPEVTSKMLNWWERGLPTVCQCTFEEWTEEGASDILYNLPIKLVQLTTDPESRYQSRPSLGFTDSDYELMDIELQEDYPGHGPYPPRFRFLTQERRRRDRASKPRGGDPQEPPDDSDLPEGVERDPRTGRFIARMDIQPRNPSDIFHGEVE